MENGEIVFCNLQLKRKNGLSVLIKECVFSIPYKGDRIKLMYNNANDRRLISKTKLKEDLHIKYVDVIASLGFRHKGSEYTEVMKNENNTRNAITGAYE